MREKIKQLLKKYNAIGRKKLYKERKYEEALEYIIRAIQCAELLDDWDGIVQNRLLLGHVYLNSMKDLNYAAEIYTKILKMFEEKQSEEVIEKSEEYFKCKYALARTLRKLGKLDQAISILEDIESKFHDNETRINVFNDLGLTYWRKASVTQNKIYLDEAIRIYDLAIELCNEEVLHKSKAMVLNNKGMAYYDQQQYDLAINTFNEALSLTNDEFYIACISNEIAKTYLKLGNFHMAKKFINKANQILLDYDEKAGEIELLRNLAIEGLYQRKIGNFEDAVNYFEMAATKLEDRELKIEAAETFHQLSLMLKERGDIRSGRYALKFEELAKEIEEQEQRLISS
ncbi:hypothetical protein BBF96_13540 [Anoxybacter fermentans]|uniref:Uncharacterized protein n=1 Tax=Anoxybacter fermentans TaxID=1323375 RepID=A0A3S9T187_9FIRM|nr:tetratricopeptide repeat protein [Anoxybacter fermentans]AZR74324.1 hypothetical protein BBF96_13540 [Anoxybacter fermentans]